MTPTAPAQINVNAAAIPLIYKPVERVALARYFGITDPFPEDLAGIDVATPVDPDEWDEDADGIAPLPSETGYDALMLENVVARICLQSSQRRLPQWASVTNETVTFARRIRRSRKMVPFVGSRHLFTINWADSGPGFSWPERYSVTHLPGYNVSVVTASDDCPDVNGYCDYAIGWFAGPPEQMDDVQRCLKVRWTELLDSGQERWAYLFDTGIVDEETANAWADEVWGSDGEAEVDGVEEGDDDVDDDEQ